MFTIPKVLRGIFRKRRHLLTLLFHTATATLQDAFQFRLGLPQPIFNITTRDSFVFNGFRALEISSGTTFSSFC